MSMARLIQDAWNKQAAWLIILRPLACLYRGGFLINRWFYQAGLRKSITHLCRLWLLAILPWAVVERHHC